MDKIVLVCQKKEGRMDDLIECLKYLFPECSLELINKEQKFLYKENTRKFS